MAGGQAVVDVQDDWQIELTGTVQSVASGVFSPSFLATFD
jgi:hypothetical protein